MTGFLTPDAWHSNGIKVEGKGKAGMSDSATGRGAGRQVIIATGERGIVTGWRDR
ncbi:MAG: hypothetical protein VB858_11770 [Planctomycetaceae bacterium]